MGKHLLPLPCRVRTLLLATGLAGVTFAASAQVVEYDYTGTTYRSFGSVTDNQSFSATLVVDYDALAVDQTDGASYNYRSNPVGSPAAVTGQLALSGGIVVTVAQGAGHDDYADLQRNFGIGVGANDYGLLGVEYITPYGSQPPSFTELSLDVHDELGTASHIFTSAAGDVSNPQAINWFSGGPGTSLSGFLWYSEPSFTSGAFLTVSSMTVRTITAAVPEPETYALMLAGLGWLGVAARRRRRAGRVGQGK